MHSANFWYRLYLSSAKATVGLLALLVFAQTASAQQQPGQWQRKQYTGELNLPNADEKFFHWGFQLGAHYSLLNLRRSNAFVQNDSLLAAEPVGSGGFSIGFIFNFALPDEYWDLRFVPMLSFYERSVDYVFLNDAGERTTVFETFEQQMLELPILVKYKSKRRRNHRLYFVGGVTPSIEMGNARQSERAEFLQLETFNLELNYGIGLDSYMNFFRFAPELRFSHGITNFLGDADNVFTGSLDRVRTFKIALILNFEG